MVSIKRVGIATKGTISLQDLLNQIKNNPDMKKGGAIATFTGIVRGSTHDGKAVQKLTIEAHRGEANKALAKISQELRTQSGIIDVLIYHLVGEFGVGEDLVYVVVVGKSRSDVFRALETAVGRYKKEVAIWKKEYLKDGTSHWTAE